ncbi:MAG: hypothetical protein LH702_20955 [Phormidesmis sp. CAN_BIN44]|nr:hypothetical protein [Phormidesmis sp. CAN_BIN44]
MSGHPVGVVQRLMMENKQCREIHVTQALIAQLPLPQVKGRDAHRHPRPAFLLQ